MSPSFKKFRSSSSRASATMSRNRKTGSACEQILRSQLWRQGFRFRKNVLDLPGAPDVVFSRQRVAVFCDGDFWHGRNWEERRRKLEKGANPGYWIAKIESNRRRDQRQAAALRRLGWKVLRLWESDIKADPMAAACAVLRALSQDDHR